MCVSPKSQTPSGQMNCTTTSASQSPGKATHKSDEASSPPLASRANLGDCKRKKITDSESGEDSDSSSGSSSDSDTEPVQFRRTEREHTRAKPNRREQTLAMGNLQNSQTQRTIEDAEVDDTDGLDPEAELEAWKQRERARVQREYDELERIETEIQETMEARRKRARVSD